MWPSVVKSLAPIQVLSSLVNLSALSTVEIISNDRAEKIANA